MLCIVVPGHNEEDYLLECLKAVERAARYPRLGAEQVEIVVVLDACTDRSASIAAAEPVISIPISARNVGISRACGAGELITRGARWLAFTDADTVVTPSWLSDQVELAADAVCGSVSVKDWLDHSVDVQQRYQAGYCDADGHRHIHGANFGVSTEAYLAAGGFQPLALSEDVALVEALLAQGRRIAWNVRPRVVTSARRDGRAPGGFAHHLLGLHEALSQSLQAAA